MASLLKSRRTWVAAGAACLVLVAVWLVCSLPLRLGNRAFLDTPDGRLVDRVLQVADLQLRPNQAESFVGAEATLNTLRGTLDRDALLHANIVADERTGGGENLALLYGGLHDGRVRHALYWVRATEAKNPRLVGVLWTNEGEARVFFGVVLPP
jgi:hypothetical protein